MGTGRVLRVLQIPREGSAGRSPGSLKNNAGGLQGEPLCCSQPVSPRSRGPDAVSGGGGESEPRQPAVPGGSPRAHGTGPAGSVSWSGRSAEVSGDGPEGGQAGTMPLTAPRCARPQNAVLVDRMFEEQGPSQTVICPPFNIFKFENIPSGKSKLHSSLSCHSSSWWPWATPTRLPRPEGCM